MDKEKSAIGNAMLEVERARRVEATLGVVVTALKDLEHLKKELGDEGIMEIQEQCLEKVRASVRRVDLVTMLDDYTIAVISVDRNPGGPRILAQKVYDVLSGAEYIRMGLPVRVEVAVGGSSGRPTDKDAIETFINAAKNALSNAMKRESAFEFET